MTNDPRVVSVGAPQTFRGQVARALGEAPDSVDWMPTVNALEESMGRGIRPQVVVLSPTVKESDAFGLAEHVARTAPATAVVLVRERDMNGDLPAAMRSGIRDVVDLSRGADDFREALQRALVWSQTLWGMGSEQHPAGQTRQGAIISVFSSKGGTGKSFLAANLATALAERTKRQTSLLDLDLELGDVFAYFGKESSGSLQDLLAIRDFADREGVLGAGVALWRNLWGFGSVPEPGGDVVAGEAIAKVLRTLRATFIYTVVDCPASYSDHALAALELSDAVCLIASLDVVGVRHLSVALDTLVTLGVPRERFRVILNRSDSKVGIGPDDVKRVMKLDVDSMIPSSRLVPTSLNKGEPLYVLESKSPVAKSVADLAEKMALLVSNASAGDNWAASKKRARFARR